MMQPLKMVNYTIETSNSGATRFIYRNHFEKLLIKNANIWMRYTKYVVSVGMLWCTT